MAVSVAEDAPHLVTCGNCLEEEGFIHNPMFLPCTHVCCETCLRRQLKKTDVIECRVCQNKCKVVIDSLSSALENVHPATFCEPCEKSGKLKMTANTYCLNCEHKFCAAHQGLHIELNWHHETQNIKEYMRSTSTVDQQKFCETHKDQVICLGCSKCLEVYCVECVSTVGLCQNGSNHKLMSLKELSAEVKRLLEPKKKECEELFDKWSAVMKEAAVTLSNWDTETEEGVRLIDDTEDKQIIAIQEKYGKLKEEYITNRSSTKDKLTEYMEKDAGLKLTEFHERIKTFRSDLSKYHCVDLLQTKKELEAKLDDMADDGFQPLVVENQHRLKTDESDTTVINAALVPTENFVIGDDLMRSRKPPTSMRLVELLAPNDYCFTSCSYKGVTYVGVSSSINRIDEAGNKTADFIKLPNRIITIRAHQDRLYILMYGQPYNIYVFDLIGQQITSWDHTDSNGAYYGNKLFIVKNQILVPDATHKRITIYNLSGKVAKQIPCPKIPSNTYISMCSAGEDSVIITTASPPQVFKYNMSTETVLWTTSLTAAPYSVASSNDVVLVSGDRHNGSKRGVWIEVLNITTGEHITELRDQEGVQTQVFDLWTENQRLLVPSYHQNSVMCYELLYD